MKSISEQRIGNYRFILVEQHRGHARRENVPQHGAPRGRDGGARRHHDVVTGVTLTTGAR
jgi:hypothetical protein